MTLAIPNRQAEQIGKRIQIDLSTRQRAILQFIEEYCRLMGRSPALREVGQRVGITSSSHIAYHVARLVRLGYLGRTQYSWRSLFLLQQGYEAIDKQPEDNQSVTVNELRDENRRLREWCEQLHRERDQLKDQLDDLMALAS